MNTDQERVKRIREALDAAKLDGVLCMLPDNLVLLSGYWPRCGLSLCWFPREGDPALLVPATELEVAQGGGIEQIHTFNELDANGTRERTLAFLNETIGRAGTVGYEGRFGLVAPLPLAGEPRNVDEAFISMLKSIAPGARDATDTLMTLRSRKTPGELEKLRKAHAIAAVGLARFRELVQPGSTEIEIAAEVERTIAVTGMIEHGAGSVRAWAQVGSGAATDTAWRFYVQSTARRVREGELCLLELGVVVDGFWADLTRVAVAGQPTEQQLVIWDIVALAQDAAVRSIKAGVTAGEVDAAARNFIAARGHAEHFPHVTGHGLGFRYHELPPLLASGSTTVLETGMVTSVEPGIYIPGWGGIRLEDNIAVGESGGERLSPLPFPLKS